MKQINNSVRCVNHNFFLFNAFSPFSSAPCSLTAIESITLFSLIYCCHQMREGERERRIQKGRKMIWNLWTIRSGLLTLSLSLCLLYACVCVYALPRDLSPSLTPHSLAYLSVTGNHSLPGTFVCSVRGRDLTADCCMQQTVIFECISRSLFSLFPPPVSFSSRSTKTRERIKGGDQKSHQTTGK